VRAELGYGAIKVANWRGSKSRLVEK